MPPLSKSEKTILTACASAAVLALFPWYAVSFGSDAGEFNRMFAEMGGNSNAFGAVEGTLAFVSILAAGGLVLADRAGALPWSKKARLLAPFVATVAAAVFMLFFMSRGQSVSMMGMSAGRTFWFYLALVAVGVAGYHAYLRWMAGARQVNDDTAAGDRGGPPDA